MILLWRNQVIFSSTDKTENKIGSVGGQNKNRIILFDF